MFGGTHGGSGLRPCTHPSHARFPSAEHKVLVRSLRVASALISVRRLPIVGCGASSHCTQLRLEDGGILTQKRPSAGERGHARRHGRRS